MIYKCDSIVLFNNKKINYLIRQQYKVLNFFFFNNNIFYFLFFLFINKFKYKNYINIIISNKNFYEI